MKSSDMSPGHETYNSLQSRLKTLSVPVCIAVMLFAMSTWISVVGVWVEMPLLTQYLPESWNLPSYLVVVIQIANIGPAVYTIYDRVRGKKKSSKTAHEIKLSHCVIDVEVVTILAVIILAALSVFMLCFLWDYQAKVGDSFHSVALLVLVLFCAFASCTSSVVFLPYMARFPSMYISVYYFGQGFCGLIPGVTGLLQGARKDAYTCRNVTQYHNGTDSNFTSHMFVDYNPPRFGVSAFFGFISFLLCVSAASFCCLHFAKRCREAERNEESNSKVGNKHVSCDKDELKMHSSVCEPMNDDNGEKLADSKSVPIDIPTSKNHTRTNLLLLIVGIINALWNGVLPATQSYTCLPYGNMVYTLAICLSWVVSPLATLPSIIAPTSSLAVVGSITFIAIALSTFHLILAGMSPHPILQGTLTGEIIIVVTAVLMAFSFSFTRVSVASILRREGGRQELLWCGAVTQLGSFCGAIVSFVLVSVVKVFQKMPKCPL